MLYEDNLEPRGVLRGRAGPLFVGVALALDPRIRHVRHDLEDGSLNRGFQVRNPLGTYSTS